MAHHEGDMKGLAQRHLAVMKEGVGGGRLFMLAGRTPAREGCLAPAVIRMTAFPAHIAPLPLLIGQEFQAMLVIGEEPVELRESNMCK